MKRTFATMMPDRIGAFLAANRCISNLGLNITRVSYNKAVDLHMLFIEVEGEEAMLDEAASRLVDMGYLGSENSQGGVVIVEFRLNDRPGTLLPVLELIHDHSFNISYISSNEDGSGFQSFKIGLFVDNPDRMSRFLHRVALLCDVRVLNHDRCGRMLDNTVFYLNFADDIASGAGLDEEGKKGLIVNSNIIMQLLDEMDGSPQKTFDYIGRFARGIYRYRRDAFAPRVTKYTFGDIPSLLIEPPSGSNVFVMDLGDHLFFVDSCFSCYKDELLSLLNKEMPGCADRPWTMLLSHADVDHAGNVDLFRKVYASADARLNLVKESKGESAWREENKIHAPYVRISKILSGYRTTSCDNVEVIGARSEDDTSPLTYIGDVVEGPLTLEVYEGRGGHVRGEIVAIERNLGLVFTGDILVNIKGFTREQAAFNSIAPYLMTSVDTIPDLAREEREYLKKVLGPGRWNIIGGHGSVLVLELI